MYDHSSLPLYGYSISIYYDIRLYLWSLVILYLFNPFIYDDTMSDHSQLLPRDQLRVSTHIYTFVLPLLIILYCSLPYNRLELPIPVFTLRPTEIYLITGYGPCGRLLNLRRKGNTWQLNWYTENTLSDYTSDPFWSQCRREHPPWRYSLKNKSSMERTSWNGTLLWHNCSDRRDSLGTLTEA